MPTDASFWANVGVLLGALVAIIGGYRSWSKAQAAKGTEHAVIAGFGMGFGNKEQSERIIAELTRIAVACEGMANRQQTQLKDTMEELMERLEESERRGR